MKLYMKSPPLVALEARIRCEPLKGAVHLPLPEPGPRNCAEAYGQYVPAFLDASLTRCLWIQNNCSDSRWQLLLTSTGLLSGPSSGEEFIFVSLEVVKGASCGIHSLFLRHRCACIRHTSL